MRWIWRLYIYKAWQWYSISLLGLALENATHVVYWLTHMYFQGGHRSVMKVLQGCLLLKPLVLVCGWLSGSCVLTHPCLCARACWCHFLIWWEHQTHWIEDHQNGLSWNVIKSMGVVRKQFTPGSYNIEWCRVLGREGRKIDGEDPETVETGAETVLGPAFHILIYDQELLSAQLLWNKFISCFWNQIIKREKELWTIIS